ncbi:SDR family NAD(P)-dependent oxidoreductase [Larsenimonas rhizosphaerae]|uniref:SDR family NAD(P)-dependent oxidoreductase n=1 Tax=Larsenimonas rhizosphaerae TaxID=2944682 RepID=UPI0020338FFA|nr:SDR family NAD(P)-dependent oxidoreductase [Larsenimonas rhizosphaerae]
MNTYQRIVIVGATSAIAEHCARLWVTRSPDELVLVGRHQEKTEAVAADLRTRAPGVSISVRMADFQSPGNIQQLVDELTTRRAVDLVLIAHGSLPDQGMCQADLSLANEALDINAISPVLFAEAFSGAMERVGQGCIAIIGSVAGDRGRKSNYIYGAAKGLVERYAQGLDHRLGATKVRVALIKPGPTDTPMTAHLKNSGPALASVEEVAQCIVKGVDKRKPVIYAPGKWNIIMLVIKLLPRFVFNKVNI